jgi:predicted Rossmann fold nucleotide-binding protein DprA/Smf involved in DNA uptake
MSTNGLPPILSTPDLGAPVLGAPGLGAPAFVAPVLVAPVLVALYLRGAPGRSPAPPRRWPAILGALRAEAADLGAAAEVLRRRGHRLEATLLEVPGLLAWAERIVEKGHALTACCPGYPSRWLSFGALAPPALHARGRPPPLPLLAVVGSRRVPAEIFSFSRRVAEEAVALGFGIVSGGAPGCDRGAAVGAWRAGGRAFAGKGADSEKACCGGAPLVELLASGLHLHQGRPKGCLLSLAEPDEPFSTANAMERNTLLYAAAAASVVVHARFKEGGTWAGARRALRTRSTRLIVRKDPEDLACRALEALGAAPLAHPADLAAALQEMPPQRALFGIG